MCVQLRSSPWLPMGSDFSGCACLDQLREPGMEVVTWPLPRRLGLSSPWHRGRHGMMVYCLIIYSCILFYILYNHKMYVYLAMLQIHIDTSWYIYVDVNTIIDCECTQGTVWCTTFWFGSSSHDKIMRLNIPYSKLPTKPHLCIYLIH